MSKENNKFKKLEKDFMFYITLFGILLVVDAFSIVLLYVGYRNMIIFASFVTVLILIVFIKIMNIDEKINNCYNYESTKIV